MIRQCQKCSKPEEPGRKFPTCAGCNRWIYCSKECQASDWSDHKPTCRFGKEEQYRIDTNALSVPLKAVLDSDIRAYHNEVAVDCAFAMRSALRIGQPTSLVESHIIYLQLEWDEQPTLLRQRFTPLSAEVIPISKARVLWQSTGGGAHSLPDSDLISSTTSFRTTMLFYASRKSDPSERRRPLATFYTFPQGIDYGFLSDTIPYNERSMNPDWNAQLLMSLRRPRIQDHELRAEDLLATETLETLGKWYTIVRIEQDDLKLELESVVRIGFSGASVEMPAVQSRLAYPWVEKSKRPASIIVPLLCALYYLRKRLIAAAVAKKRQSDRSQLSTPQLELAQRDLYRPLPNGSRELLVPTRGTVSKVTIHPTKQTTFKSHQPLFTSNDPRRPPGAPAPSTTARVAVNKEFFRQLSAIFKIIIPRTTSKEVFLIVAHSSFLLLRTYLSLLVAQLDGKLVGDLVSANGPGFARGLMYWFALAVPSVYTNSMIRYLQQKLSISFRTRLTRYVHDLYLSPENNFYKVVNLDGRIDGADQFITTDIARFCDTLSALYSNISKPTLDLVLFNIQLGRSIGKYGSLGLAVSYIATAWVLRKVTPAFGKLAAVEAKLEGDFRAAHSRLIINSEEIAFYNGAHMEKDILNRAYLRLIKHVNSIFKIRIVYSMIEDLVVKYFWSACGYCLISIPVFFGPGAAQKRLVAAAKGAATASGEHESEGKSIASRTESYISNRRLLLSLADAGGRLMYSWKDLAELAGYTSRVYALLSTLHDLNANHYTSLTRPDDLDVALPFYDLGSINGLLVETPTDNGVEFDKVPIVAPAPGIARGGEELVKSLNVKVLPGEHLMISGPNGSGKTSVARVLAGLWPVFEGIVRRPANKDIFFLPQRPYLSAGSLRDQIIYPHAYPDYAASGKTEADLLDILKNVHLAYLPAREGGLDTRKEWKDVLSGGEKQRMGIARLFYHLPKFGVLDECTSAVSTDVEGSMYQHAKDLGITLITISHRPSLFKYHHHLLKLTGHDGVWETSQIGTAAEHLSFQKEIDSLEEKLRDVDSWKARLAEIDGELSFTS